MCKFVSYQDTNLVWLCVTCRWQPSMGDDGWGPPLDQSLIADSTLIYPRAQARSRPDSLQLSTASLRPQGQLRNLRFCWSCPAVPTSACAAFRQKLALCDEHSRLPAGYICCFHV